MSKSPLIQISRRKDIVWYKAWLIRIIAIVLALILCGIITMVTTGLNPVKVYGAMLDGAFGTSRRIWMLLLQQHRILRMPRSQKRSSMS